MTKEEFISELSKLNIKVINEQLELLNSYYKFLIEYNAHTNLTSITDESAVYLKHFYDSLTLIKVTNLNNFQSLLDIGSGAGFPGIILKIFFPNLNITLLDSNNKKTKFLELLIKELKLQNIKVINSRSEDYIKKNRESFDIVTARAVADLRVLAELSLPFVTKNGYFIALKGDAETEIKNAEQTIKILGGEILKIENLLLPKENSRRKIILIKKINSTPKIYPRFYSQILKKPLKINQK